MKNNFVIAALVVLLAAGWWTSDSNGHIALAGTAPTVTSCGAGASVDGNDSIGIITPGTGSPTSCTITFARAYVLKRPVCVVSIGASSVGPAITIDDTTDETKLVINAASGLAADTPISYVCLARVW